MRVVRLLPFALICVVAQAWANQVVVANTGGDPLYAAVYEYNRATGKAKRVQVPVRVKVDQTMMLDYHDIPLMKRATHVHMLIYDEEKDSLVQTLDKRALSRISTMRIGKAQKLRIPAKKDMPAVKDHVTVTNLSEQPWYIAMYIVPHSRDKGAQRYSDVIRVDPDQRVLVARPDFGFREKIQKDRLILFHENQDMLEESVAYGDRAKLPYMHAGTLNGNAFFIAENADGAVQGYDLFSWKTRDVRRQTEKMMQHVFQAMTDPFVQKVRKEYLDPTHNPWVRDTAQVRTGKQQHKGEQEALSKREKHIRTAIGKLLGRELQDDEPTPRIALVCSGGGFRAMFATLGAMQGAYESGVWDALSYVVGLSGSTWAIAPYMTSQANMPNFVSSAKKRGTKEFSAVKGGIEVASEKQELFTKQLASRIAFQQTLSLIDPYGFLLGWHLLQDIRPADNYLHQQAATLAHQRDRVRDGKEPFPVYTAVIGQTERVYANYTWMYFTPYEVGSQAFGGYVPSWALGRKYNAGTSVNGAPPYPLGYCMGIWGSAFSATLQDMYTEMLAGSKVPLVEQAFKGVADTRLGNQRLLPARVPNFTYNIDGAPMRSRKYVSLIDGGYSCNLPISAVLPPERNVDMIVMLDVSGDIATSPELGELQKAVEIASNHDVPMPKIDYKKAYNNVASLFMSDNPEAPAIVYMPMIRNPQYGQFDPRENIRRNGYLRTTNFFYTQEQAQQFMGLHKRNIKDAVPQIQKAIEHMLTR